ncbi:autotransporter outer membrane beta-barrel domain-containing protein [Rhodopseudomonas sp. P2A-2r]|uniref:autotransporter outer membrane beta-barrel domain-containing protein n=1 Tax=Rhodopseudomonas sp. P2A-2r TaxID=2991972 RepID=UPI0022342791|nr:autotransporter outer membrane beta-barrel domain-containing protein [Rhodopseudomonas sp. P2A-2r]UZE49513.1 autotransporter outer membrane beta-barrel domain-containing protein [Rhodopseudomonas sp. P2A-2r]
MNFAGCFYQNSVHPTGAAMALIATYMANQIDAPTTVVPQGAITASLAAGFAGSVFGRLDASRTSQPFGIGNAMAMAYAGPTKAPSPLKPEDRWSVYSDFSYASGSLDRQFFNAGYDYHAPGGTFGIEYRYDSRWRLGFALGYSEPDVTLGVQNAHDHVKSYQFAGYGSFTDANWFVDALAAYGRHDFALDRQGVIDVIHGSTSADTFTTAARAGYLVNAGAVRVGPIAGFSYTHGVIGGYTESGDVLLTMMVDRQTINALTANAGLQLRLPFVTGMVLYSPFINLTAEQDFAGSGRNVTTTLVTAPLLPILTPVSAQDRTYGRVAAGIGAGIAGNINATLTITSTFARAGGNDFAVSSGIRAAF